MTVLLSITLFLYSEISKADIRQRLCSFFLSKIENSLNSKSNIEYDEKYFLNLFKESENEWYGSITLYRGVTGSEKDGKNFIFLTDEVEAACTYGAKNGNCEVLQYSIPQSALYVLRQQDFLMEYEDNHVYNGSLVRHHTYLFKHAKLKNALNIIAKSYK